MVNNALINNNKTNNKTNIMKTTSTILLLLLTTSLISNSAWVWTNMTNQRGTSGSFELDILHSDYDTTNAINNWGWDVTPVPVTITYDSGSEEISIDDNFQSKYFTVNLDPDGNGVLPDSVIISVDYGTPISWRGQNENGTIGSAINNLGLVANLSMTGLDGAGNSLSFDHPSSLSFFADALTTGETVTWQSDDSTPFYGVDGTTLNQGDFPFSSTDATQQMSSQTWTISNITSGTQFRMTLDGGVGVVPEPSSTLLIGLGFMGAMIRRRR